MTTYERIIDNGELTALPEMQVKYKIPTSEIISYATSYSYVGKRRTISYKCPRDMWSRWLLSLYGIAYFINDNRYDDNAEISLHLSRYFLPI